MSRAGQVRRGAVGARLVALLALVLGLLGMHGLASNHHAAAAPGHAPSIALVADEPVLPPDQAEPHQHAHAGSGAPAVTASAGSLAGGNAFGPAVPVCGDDCTTDLALLCAAVVAAAAATAWLSAATARRRLRAPTGDGGPRTRAPGGARQLLPRLDPVAELCVSRT